MENLSPEEVYSLKIYLMEEVLKLGAVEIRDVDQGEEPFLYSSGNWGPGYVNIKGLVGHLKGLRIIELMSFLLSTQLRSLDINLVAGNVTGGVIPGWIIATELKTHYVYVRGSRKAGGHRELITGLEFTKIEPQDSNVLIVEGLVNFAETTANSAVAFREAGYNVKHCATILFYDNPQAKKKLEILGLTMHYLFTLPELLNLAKEREIFPASVMAPAVGALLHGDHRRRVTLEPDVDTDPERCARVEGVGLLERVPQLAGVVTEPRLDAFVPLAETEDAEVRLRDMATAVSSAAGFMYPCSRAGLARRHCSWSLMSQPSSAAYSV